MIWVYRIVMDVHAHDVLQKMIKNKVNTVDSFMWQSQLKHKFRVPPIHEEKRIYSFGKQRIAASSPFKAWNKAGVKISIL